MNAPFTIAGARPVMLRVCAWCRKSMGTIECRPANAGQVTHGICDDCVAREFAALPGPARPNLNEAAAAQAVSTLAGAPQPLQDERNATPDEIQSAVMDNPSGDPAASFNDSGGFWAWADRLIKRFTTAGGRNE